MKYVITRDGHKCPVDDSSVDYQGFDPFRDRVAVLDDGDYLRKIWILELNKTNRSDGGNRNWREFETEFVKELRYDHKPSKEEILWAMAEYGLRYDDIAIVKEAYEKGYDYDD